MPVTFTNKHNIPEHISRAIMVDDHVTKGDISVTSLIDSPKIFYLKSQTNYEMDVMDLIPAFMGTGLHTALERAEKGRYKARILRQCIGVLTELGKVNGAESLKRILTTELNEEFEDEVIREKTWTIDIDGWTISGTLDVYNKRTCFIEDHKMTTASAFMFPELKESWRKQMNCYAAILRANGYEVKGAIIHAFFKDWSRAKIASNRDYPKTIYMPVKIELADNDQVMKYMSNRVKVHQNAKSGIDIPCTGKDRWESATTYAIKKTGGKKALRVSDTPEGAKGLLDQMAHKYEEGTIFIETRKGQARRCAEYCPVNHICDQYKADLASMAKEAEDFEGV